MEFPAALKQLIHQPQNVAILSHRNPDGDAIGSVLAMRHYLVQYGHTVHVLFPSEFPEEFEALPGADDILIWDIHTEECKHVLRNKNLFMFLDFNALNRIDKMGDFIRDLPGTRILIDHSNLALADDIIARLGRPAIRTTTGDGLLSPDGRPDSGASKDRAGASVESGQAPGEGNQDADRAAGRPRAKISVSMDDLL